MCRVCPGGQRSNRNEDNENTSELPDRNTKASFIVWIMYLDTDHILIAGASGVLVAAEATVVVARSSFHNDQKMTNLVDTTCHFSVYIFQGRST